MSRRWLAPEAASELGRLDPEAIARVRAEAWPDPTNADELHDALVWLGFLGAEETQPAWSGWLAELARARRATRLCAPRATLWIAAERLPQFQALWPGARLDPVIAAPGSLCRAGLVARRRADRDSARTARGAGAGHRGRARGAARIRGGVTSRPGSRLSGPKASPCADASRRERPRTNGASVGCSPGFTAPRSTACAPKSSRSPRATFCASSFAGSGLTPMHG